MLVIADHPLTTTPATVVAALIIALKAFDFRLAA
jgi:hypothetical protein